MCDQPRALGIYCLRAPTAGRTSQIKAGNSQRLHIALHISIPLVSAQSLLAMLNTTEQAGFRIQHPDGCDFHEVRGQMCNGSYFKLQDQYLIFLPTRLCMPLGTGNILIAAHWLLTR